MALTVCISAVAFVFCWSPYFVYDLLDVYRLLENYDMQRKYYVTVFVQSLSHLNSVANPVIYMLFNTSIVGSAWFVLQLYIFCL